MLPRLFAETGDFPHHKEERTEGRKKREMRSNRKLERKKEKD